MKQRISRQLVITILGVFLLYPDGVYSQRRNQTEADISELDDFMVYADPIVMDALRKRPFTKRDPIVEQFFKQLPGISDDIYDKKLKSMRDYFTRCKADKDRKIQRLAELAGLDQPPQGLVDGYNDRIKTLETILRWLENNKLVELIRLNVWREPEVRYSLARFPIEDMRINAESDEIESRLQLNWRLIFQPRKETKDMVLEFAMGVHLQQKTGFYDPKGFVHWEEIRRKDLKGMQLTYPVIISEALRNNPEKEMPAYVDAYRTTIDSFYHILEEFFFSDLADLHTLFILTRGRIFTDEWQQYQATGLQRGLAAYLSFQTLEEQIGTDHARSILENDWTTWHTRKIGSEFDDLVWDEERKPFSNYLSYKDEPNMTNIFWSTKFVYQLVDKYGSGFVPQYCDGLRSAGKKAGTVEGEEALFKKTTGEDLTTVILSFLALHSGN